MNGVADLGNAVLCSWLALLISATMSADAAMLCSTFSMVWPASCTRRLPAFTWLTESSIRALISLAAVALRCASWRTSVATTAKAAALFAGAGGLDRCVQCQDVGLEGNAVDDTDDVLDLARGVVYAVHGLHHLLHGSAACAVTCRPPAPADWPAWRWRHSAAPWP